MPRVNVLILDGESMFTPKVVRPLGRTGRWRLHVLARGTRKEQPTLAWSRHLHSFHLTPPGGTDEQYLAAIREVAARTRAEIIMPVVEPTALFCIRHRAELEKIARLTPLPTEDRFTAAVDKGTLASFMAEHGIDHPRTCLVSELATAGLRYPLLVKPRRGLNGQGIVKVETPAALHRELASRPDRAGLCVQEYVEGEDRGCSVLVQNGEILAWTSQRGLRRFGAYEASAEVLMEPSQPVYDAAARLMRALNWSGLAHIDLRLDARTGELRILEVNARYWSSLWASTAARVNFPDLLCRLSLDEPLPEVRSRSGRFVHLCAALSDVRRLRPQGFQFRWNGLSMILSDPLPEAIRYGQALLKRLPRPSEA